MLDLLVLTVFLPLLGAGGVFLLSFLFSRLTIKRGYIRALVATLAIAIVVLACIVALGSGGGSKVVLSSPYPALLTEWTVEMRWDDTLWALGLSLSVIVGVLLLDAAARDEQSFHLVGALLVLLATGLAALWSANPLTTIVCWAFYDVAFALGRMVAGDRTEDAVRSLALGTGSGLLLWAGVLAGEGGMGSVPWARMPSGGAKMTYWTLAGFFRLGAYPFHIWFPRSIRSPSALTGAFFLSPVLGWGLWIRLALVSEGALPVETWMVISALLTLVGGGILAWTANSSRESRPWIGVGGHGAVILSAVLASLATEGQGVGGETVAALMTVGAVGWMLGTTLLFLDAGIDLRGILKMDALPRNIPLLIGALSLIGAPTTAGFVGESSLLRELVRAGRWGWYVGFLVGHAFLVVAVMRWLFASDRVDWEGSSLLGEIAHGVGLISLAVCLVVSGILLNWLLPDVSPSSASSLRALLAAPGLAGWLLWGGGLLLGGILAWLDAKLRPRISLWLNVIHDAVLLDWGYDLLMGAFERGLSVLRVADTVLSGRGALLWSCLLLLVVVLVVGG